MEELIIIQNKIARKCKNVKFFNFKWWEDINGSWEKINDTHFCVSHLGERQKNEILNLINQSIYNDVLEQTSYIDINKIVIDTINDSFSIGKTPEEKRLKSEKALQDLIKIYKEDVSFDESSGIINYELINDRESRKYDYTINNFREKNIVDDMISIISKLSNHLPAILCEDLLKEKEILKFISNLRIDQKDLVKELLEKGSIVYEKCFNCTQDTLIGLRKLNKSKLTKIGNVYNYENDQIFTYSDLIFLDFYPNEEFESYREMMEKLKNDYKISDSLKCSFDNVINLDEKLKFEFYVDFFIKKSFVPRYMFNISQQNSFDNNNNNFYSLLEKTIFNFYDDLIKSNIKFKYYNFTLFKK